MANILRAVPDPGNSFMRSMTMKTQIPTITATANATEMTAGLRAVFSQLRFFCGISFSLRNHSAISSETGVACTRSATALSNDC